MADTFKGIITADGKKRQLPYGAVLDRPVSDKTLSEEGGFADAKVVGNNFAKVDSETASLKEDLSESLTYLNDLVGKDYFNHEISATGVYLNQWGGEVISPTYQVSVFIPVVPGITYILPHNSHYFIHSYTENKTIDSKLWIEVAQTTDESYSFTPAENIYFIKISYPIGAEFYMYIGNKPSNTLKQAYEDIDVLKERLTPQIIHITPSSDIIDILKNNFGRTFYVEDGIYNVIEIYKAKYGSDYFENKSSLTGESIEHYGLPLKNGSKLICSPNAKFVCNYAGTNTYVIYGFSAFACGNGYEIDGLNVEASNVKYAIHDDYNTYNDIGYRVCVRNSTICNANRDAIGGGLGKYGSYVFENNYFECTNGSYDVRYHNNSEPTKCYMRFVNNVFNHTLRLAYYGSSAVKTTKCYISNNKMTSNIINNSEDDIATTNNFDIIEWNNVISN